MKNYLVIIFISSLLISCESNSSISEHSYNSDCLRVPKSEKDSYFPESAFDDDSSYEGRAEFLSKWYSMHLFSMNEPIIYKCSNSSECYRFTWLRTFHQPIAVRITRTKDQIKLSWKKTNGAGGYEAGKIIEKGSKNISTKELDKFKSKLKKCEYFNMTTIANNDMGTDGARWILEGINSDSDYHLVDRWCPSETLYGEACLYLLELTDLQVKRDLIY